MRQENFVVSDPVDSHISGELVPFLERGRLYGEDFLYSVIDGDRLDEFREHGTYRIGEASIHAYEHDQLSQPELAATEPFDVALSNYRNSAVAVFRADKFDRLTVPHEFRFKHPDRKLEAVVAVVTISLPAT